MCAHITTHTHSLIWEDSLGRATNNSTMIIIAPVRVCSRRGHTQQAGFFAAVSYVLPRSVS